MRLGMEVCLIPAPFHRKGAESSPQKNFSAHVYCDTWHGRMPQPMRLCVRWGPSHPPKGVRASSQVFDPFLLWPSGWIKMQLGMEVGLSTWDVLDGDPAPSTKRMWHPQFSAHVYCDQTAARIKMPLGTEVAGLGPDDIVFDGTQLPSRKSGRAPSPIFGPFLLWPNGWMDQDGTWHGDWPRSRDSRPHCVRWVPSSRPQKGA